ncbi:MAG TPA: PTS sugar transporter subunit IIB [Longimicrobiales bacterium]|nr:PTS sugar transporter subunit IIB [Longimicrobiales bacterium]
MSIVLFRIDERLIHGQVVVGWEAEARPDRVIVVDDALAASRWEQELYELGLPPALRAVFASVEDARARLDEWRSHADRIILLTRDAATMAAIGGGGLLDGVDINVGGLHHAPGRRQVLPYVFLSPDEEQALRDLASGGARVSARDLPGSRRVPLEQLLGGESK